MVGRDASEKAEHQPSAARPTLITTRRCRHDTLLIVHHAMGASALLVRLLLFLLLLQLASFWPREPMNVAIIVIIKDDGRLVAEQVVFYCAALAGCLAGGAHVMRGSCGKSCVKSVEAAHATVAALVHLAHLGASRSPASWSHQLRRCLRIRMRQREQQRRRRRHLIEAA